jgi:site-specific DNA-methyltransferase (adenine-specific)
MKKNLGEIILGDCIEKMKDIPDESIDFICTDLPFGSTKNHWDIQIPFDTLWEQYLRIIKPGCAMALFGSGLFAHELALSYKKGYKYDIV